MRATCAQALGVVARLMEEEHVLAMSRVLLLLASESQWEVRHASLMGMQHLLAARTVSGVGEGHAGIPSSFHPPLLQELSSLLLPSLFPSILQGLQDLDDDVRAVAAAALLPVSQQLPSIIPHQVGVYGHTPWTFNSKATVTEVFGSPAGDISVTGSICTDSYCITM